MLCYCCCCLMCVCVYACVWCVCMRAPYWRQSLARLCVVPGIWPESFQWLLFWLQHPHRCTGTPDAHSHIQANIDSEAWNLHPQTCLVRATPSEPSSQPPPLCEYRQALTCLLFRRHFLGLPHLLSPLLLRFVLFLPNYNKSILKASSYSHLCISFLLWLGCLLWLLLSLII